MSVKKDWSRLEVEAIVDDYLSMLASELAGVPYNKTSQQETDRLDWPESCS